MGAHVCKVEDAGREAIVEVRSEVGDLVGQVDELRFERRLLIKEIRRKFRMFDGIVVARVLDDALADAQGEIEAREGCVTLLEGSDDAERVQVVIEAQAMRVHCFVEGAFARMAEGRMSDVVHQRERFGEVSVESESGSDGARKLRHFNGVGEATPVVVGVAVGKHLCLAGEAAKRTRMNDAGAVALKG